MEQGLSESSDVIKLFLIGSFAFSDFSSNTLHQIHEALLLRTVSIGNLDLLNSLQRELGLGCNARLIYRLLTKIA